METLLKNEVSPEEQRQQALMFYARVGDAITSYQQIEDRLPAFFALASRASETSALVIFNLLQGLEKKLAAISAAFLDLDAELLPLWDIVKTEIKRSADHRNQIAHSTAVFYGRTMVFSEEKEFLGFRDEEQGLQLRKATKSSELTWTSEKLKQEIGSLDQIQKMMTVLYRYISDGFLEERFKGYWDHPTVQSWSSK